MQVESNPLDAGSVDYLDFELDFDREPGRKTYAIGLRSPAGEISATMRLRLDAKTLQAQLNALEEALIPFEEQPLEGSSPIDKPAQELGEVLFDALFTSEVRGMYDRSRDIAKAKGAGLRVKLRINQPELAALPWEFLYDPRPAQSEYICLSRHTPIVRYVEIPEPIESLTVKPPLRILAMIASPQDLERLDVKHERQRLEQATKDLRARGIVELGWMRGQTWRDVQQALQGGPWHVFHFIGHGSFDPTTGESFLSFADDAQQADDLNAEQIGRLLANHEALGLVLLNSCEGARGNNRDIFSSMAAALVSRGIPAVIAMQYAISDDAALEFSYAFYRALAEGLPVDAAVAEARVAISMGVPDTVEWGTPVLFMRSPNGRIFEVERKSAEQQRRSQITFLADEAQVAMVSKKWQEAEEKLQAILDLDPADVPAKTNLAEVMRQRELATLYQEAQQHYSAGRLRQALDLFNRVSDIGGNYNNVWRISATIQKELGTAEAAQAQPAPAHEPGKPSIPEVVPAQPSSLPARSPRAAPNPQDLHYRTMIRALANGRLVPFLGPDVSAFGRPPGVAWRRGQYLPRGAEVVKHLVENYGYPATDPQELMRVSQHINVMSGHHMLYDELRGFYGVDYPPTPIHQFFAKLPKLLRQKGAPRPYQLIVNATYDDVLERAFQAEGEEFDLVSYIAEGKQRGKFWHYPPGRAPRLIERPNEEIDLSTEQRTVIMKLHGMVNRSDPEQDSYVVTEDNYIDYLARADISNLIPVTLLEKLRRSVCLFLGYSLREWNLRVIMNRIWGDQNPSDCWAVQPEPQAIDRAYWTKLGVPIIEARLEDYLATLDEYAQAYPSFGSGV